MAIAAKKPKWAQFNTPEGVLVYPWLNKPDVGRQYSDGNYTTQIAFEGAAAEEMQARIDKLCADAAAAYQAATGKKKAPKIESPLKPEIDKESEEPTGRLLFKTKLEPESKPRADGTTFKSKPRFLKPVDGKVALFATEPQVFGGTKARLGLDVNPLPVEAKGLFYLQHRLRDVLILELAKSNRTGSSFGDLVEDPDAKVDSSFSSEDGDDGQKDGSDF